MAPLLSSVQGRSLFEIDFSANIAEVSETMRYADRWIVPYAASTALSKTAYEASQAEGMRLAASFDQPTPFTRKSVLYKKATADNLTYRIFLRDEARNGTPPAVYLRPSVHAGPRRLKPYEALLRRIGVLGEDEFTIPAIGIRRNAYGNLPGAVISKIVSQLGARRDPLQNTTARSRKRSKAKGGARYFVPNEAHRRSLPRGVYERMASGKIRAVLIFVSGPPRYRKRYPFGQAARTKAQRVFGPHFKAAFANMLSKL